jgi:hypothetical protein
MLHLQFKRPTLLFPCASLTTIYCLTVKSVRVGVVGKEWKYKDSYLRRMKGAQAGAGGKKKSYT